MRLLQALLLCLQTTSQVLWGLQTDCGDAWYSLTRSLFLLPFSFISIIYYLLQLSVLYYMDHAHPVDRKCMWHQLIIDFALPQSRVRSIVAFEQVLAAYFLVSNFAFPLKSHNKLQCFFLLLICCVLLQEIRVYMEIIFVCSNFLHLTLYINKTLCFKFPSQAKIHLFFWWADFPYISLKPA